MSGVEIEEEDQIPLVNVPESFPSIQQEQPPQQPPTSKRDTWVSNIARISSVGNLVLFIPLSFLIAQLPNRIPYWIWMADSDAMQQVATELESARLTMDLFSVATTVIFMSLLWCAAYSNVFSPKLHRTMYLIVFSAAFLSGQLILQNNSMPSSLLIPWNNRAELTESIFKAYREKNMDLLPESVLHDIEADYGSCHQSKYNCKYWMHLAVAKALTTDDGTDPYLRFTQMTETHGRARILIYCTSVFSVLTIIALLCLSLCPSLFISM